MLSTPSSANPAAVPSRPTGAEGFASILAAQDVVDALCEEHGVPGEFTARLAGDLRANSTPPPGAICVYARALEAGMRVPLHPFFREALAHFGLAPAQLTPNAWRIMAGFLVLCHSAGVPPSLALLRHFFMLSVVTHKHWKGWYFFRPKAKDGSGLRFTAMPKPNSVSLKGWKHEFFFLSSPDPWPCAVDWGRSPKTSLMKPVLTAEENKSAAKLLRLHGGAAVDLRAYLSSSNLAAAMIATTASLPPPRTHTTSCSKGMDPAVHDMMKTMLAEKEAARASASASANKVRNAQGSPSLCGEKRGLEEADGEEEVPPHSVLNTPPPGFSQMPQHVPSRHEVDTTDWEAARELLHGAVTTPLERAFAASEPSEIVKSGYAAILQAANYASFSFRYALELEEKLAARERQAAALREQLEDAKAELAAVKRAAEVNQENAGDDLAAAGAELEKGKWAREAEAVTKRDELAALKWAAEAEAEKAKAELAAGRAEAVTKRDELAALKSAAEAEAEKAKAELAAAEAVQQFLASEEDALRRAEHALAGYELWRGRHAPAGHAASLLDDSLATNTPYVHK